MASARRGALILCAVALLSVVSVSRSAPLACDKLFRPLEPPQPDFYRGRWALVAGSLGDARAREALRLRDSITMFFSNSTGGTSQVSYTQVNRFGDECRPLRYNVSVQGSSFSFDGRGRFELAGTFLHTSCPDCLVMQWHVTSRTRNSTELYLLSRRRELEPREMAEFETQLQCNMLPAAVLMDPSKDLCVGPPYGEDNGSPQTAATEATTKDPQL